MTQVGLDGEPLVGERRFGEKFARLFRSLIQKSPSPADVPCPILARF